MLSNVADLLPLSFGKNPQLWVRRFVLLSNVFPMEIIRDFPMSPGINLIVGSGQVQQESSNPKTPFASSGHSVGKTTCCRLLRYLLGEANYGTKKYQEKIGANFPDGWVAAEVWIQDNLWAIAKPLSNNKRFAPRAVKNATVDKLFVDFSAESSAFDQYLQELDALLPPFVGLPGFSPSWQHFFAWLTRDQECRLRDYWAWRDSKTNSGTSFSSSVTYPQHIVLGSLGLLSSETYDLEEETADLKRKLDLATETCNKLLSEPRLRCIDLEKKLRQLTSTHLSPKIEAAGPLLSFDSQIGSKIADWEKSIEQHQNDLKEVDYDIATILPFYHSTKVEYNTAKASIDAYTEARETRTENNPNPGSSALQKLQKDFPSTCPYARNIRIKDCEHAISKYKELTSNVIRMSDAFRSTKKASEIQELTSMLEHAQYELAEKKENFELASATYTEHIERRSTINEKLTDLIRLRNEALFLQEELRKQKDICDGKSDNAELLQAQIEEQELTEAYRQATEQLKNCKEHLFSQTTFFNSTFSGLVKALFGDLYSGTFISKKGLELSVYEDGELAGSVVETLSIILADITAMLSGGKSENHHPGFLLHDSPREADLSPVLYERLLLISFELEKFFEAQGSIPFQYIVTTTTPQPGVMDKNVVLQLDNTREGMLFKEFLQIPKVEDSQVKQMPLV